MKEENILIIEDSQFTASLINDYLTDHNLRVCGVASNYNDAYAIFKTHCPTLVICDIHIEGNKSGIEFIASIKEQYPAILVIFISSDIKTNILSQAQETQPNAYLTKPFTQEQLLTTVDMALMQHKNSKPEIYNVTHSDIEVLQLLGQGKTNIEVGKELYISHHTVDSRRRKIMVKLNVSSINKALCIASRNGWIHITEKKTSL